MKYIVIGLGNYGSSLAVELTQLGHEVVGVDIIEHNVVDVKDKIASAIKLDATELMALKMLPLHDVDAVIVAIGENFGASVEVVAMLKQEKIKSIYVRALSHVHTMVLESLNVERILTPEKDSARILAQSMEFKNVISSYKIDDNHYVIKFITPVKFEGHTVSEIGLNKNFNLNIVAVSASVGTKNVFGTTKVKSEVIEVDLTNYKLSPGDILVVYGLYNDFQKLWRAM